MYWDVRETGRCRPDTGEGQRRPATRHSALVVKRVSDGDIPVPADTAQMQQRCGREQNVIGVEHIAGQRPEQPLTSYHLHHHHTDLQLYRTLSRNNAVAREIADSLFGHLRHYMITLGNTLTDILSFGHPPDRSR